ncbi:MAG: hypothetical protein HYU58_20385 [Proteobacteria bacterium]|nr:hypothetical protein [Pseudomonadota bacterium]
MGQEVVSLIPGFCEIFLGECNFDDGGMVYWDQIDLSAYDYSVASLLLVDRYLDAVRGIRAQLKPQTYTNIVLATGSYVGEVVRRRSDKPWEWMNFDDFMQQHADTAAAFGITAEKLNVAAVLAAGKAITLPFNKVMRNLEEGPENSIHFYAISAGAGD